MTYSTNSKVSVGLIASHKENGTVVELRVGSSTIDLDIKQREELAAYLLKENN
jgi:hypothetical protein